MDVTPRGSSQSREGRTCGVRPDDQGHVDGRQRELPQDAGRLEQTEQVRDAHLHPLAIEQPDLHQRDRHHPADARTQLDPVAGRRAVRPSTTARARAATEASTGVVARPIANSAAR